MTCKAASRAPSAMFLLYISRLVLRFAIFLLIFFLYLTRREVVASFTAPGFFEEFGFRQALWCLLMAGMLLHLLPKSFISMSGRKSRPSSYLPPNEPYDADELLRYMQLMNVKAWQVMLLWLCVNAFFALLYLLEFIGEAEMVLLTFFYFLCDLVCMMLFCPFQAFIMKNRCCVNCRIFDWGHFMMYTPMLFVKSFFGWSLFFTACIVLIRWEIVWASHPERFWHGSNAALRCENCRDRLCRIKQPLHEMYRHVLRPVLPGCTDAACEKEESLHG